MAWAWVETLDEVQERRQHARRLIGLQFAAVRYCEIDYAYLDRPEGKEGLRHVVNEAEWQEPSFRYRFGDSVDYGVELETACGRVFTVSWDSPGRHEGVVWLREVPLVGQAVQADTNTAIWACRGRVAGIGSSAARFWTSGCITGRGHLTMATGVPASPSPLMAATSSF